MTPGQLMQVATRIPPSKKAPLAPFKGSFQVAPEKPPLSEVKTISVLPASPWACTASLMRPTPVSTASIMAA